MSVEPPMPGADAAAAYDSVPYQGFAYADTSIERLYIAGRIFGMEPPDIRTARVLEIGCARGSNLAPMAERFRDARFVGVDISAAQIAHAAELSKILGLTNVDWRAMSVADIGPDMGQFDYIVCHGVYSWVPPAIQDAILNVCRARLSSGGLAVVSYNTLPGWNMARTIRDMMRYHVENIDAPAHKAAQARLLLQFVRDSAGDDPNDPYAAFLNQEASSISSSPDWYLLHDHLEADNNPCYFHEFVARAAGAGLQYVADTNVASMSVDGLPEKAAAVLAQVPELVRQEQYSDFVRNRRFRSSVLTHGVNSLDRDVSRMPMAKLTLRSLLAPKAGEASVDLATDARQEFVASEIGVTISIANRLTAALLLALYQMRNKPAASDEIVERARALIGGGFGAALIAGALAELIPKLVLRGCFVLYAGPGDYVTEVSERPIASPIARHLAVTEGHVVNRRHEVLHVSEFVRALTPLLDGTRDLAALVEFFVAKVTRGEAAVPKDVPGGDIRSYLTAAVRNDLQDLAAAAVLIG